MMWSGRGALRQALAFGLAAACAVASGAGADAPESPLVIDPGTFAAVPSARSSTGVSRAMGDPGPRIVLLSPGHDAVFRAGEPMALHAELLPAADGAAPDMETLSVRVWQGLRGKDITDMVRPYVKGGALRVPVDFSGHAGEFQFEMDVMDARGRMGEMAFRVTFKLELRDALLRDGET